MLKTMFFDFGGTLMDNQTDERAHLEIASRAKERWGLTGTPKEIWNECKRFAKPMEERLDEEWIPSKIRMTAAFEKILGRKMNRFEKEWFLYEYDRAHRLYVRLFPETVDVLKDLSKKGLRLGIISNIDDDFLYSELLRTGIIEFFTSITTSCGVGFGKPNPRIFNIAIQRANVTPGESVHIGDSIENDIIGARNVGMKTIFIGAKPYNGADYSVSGIGEVGSVIKEIRERGREIRDACPSPLAFHSSLFALHKKGGYNGRGKEKGNRPGDASD
jgi:HAD superfamily hydrolase (TIGR01549 family)